MSIEDNYYSEFREIFSKIDGKLQINELADIHKQLFELTKDAASEFATENFRPDRDWDEKTGNLSRELKFLREEVKVIMDFYNSRTKPDTFCKSESVHCLQGSQSGDAIRYDANREIGHIEICFPIQGYEEKKDNEEIRKTGFSQLIDLDQMRFPDKELEEAVVNKFASQKYPEKTVLIVNFGPTECLQLDSPTFKDIQFLADKKFTEIVDWMKSQESNFSEVYAMYRWEPYQIYRTK